MLTRPIIPNECGLRLLGSLASRGSADDNGERLPGVEEIFSDEHANLPEIPVLIRIHR
jgi:hypothetical protein